MRVFRLLRLLDQLRLRSRPVTAQELAGLMAVSLRTLYRDIADLQAMGAPIRGAGGLGYVMEKGYFMPSLSFDAEELAALALGTRLVAARSGETLAAAAQRAAAKIASALGDSAREGMLQSPLAAGPSAAAPDAAAAALQDALCRSIARHETLQITYTSLSGATSERIARPLGLTVFDRVWLLTIWCEASDAFRHLRLDRIGQAEPTGQRFRPERGKRFADALDGEAGSQERAMRDGP